MTDGGGPHDGEPGRWARARAKRRQRAVDRYAAGTLGTGDSPFAGIMMAAAVFVVMAVLLLIFMAVAR